MGDPDPDIPRITRVAAYALCTDDDQILLCRTASGYTMGDDGKWTLPGGGLDFGEPPEAAVLRELGEETGLTGQIDGVAGICSWSDRLVGVIDAAAAEADYHAICIVYRITIDGGELRDEVGGSTDTCRWIRRADLDALALVDTATFGVGLAFER